MNVQLRDRGQQYGANASPYANQPYTFTLKAPGDAAVAQTQARANEYGY